jgi:hypothetical protein
MAGSGNWLDQLEARLEQTLESFLQANPQQDSLLAEQEARERQQQLRRDRVTLKAEAELQRQGLLRLAEDIRCWQQRVDRANGAGALDLAFAAVERELQTLGANPSGQAFGTAGPGASANPPSSGPNLEADWAAFETQQELDALRRKMQG